MAYFRDISTASIGGTAIPGIQEIGLKASGDEIEHSSAASDAIDYRGMTNLQFDASVDCEAGTDYLRDVFGVTFDGGSIPDVTAAEIKETSSEIVDASDADLWITFVGVTKRSVEGMVTTRDVGALSALTQGDVGTLILKAKIGSLTSGLTTTGSGSDTTFTALSMELVDFGPTGKHADLAEGQASFKATASVKVFTGGDLSAVHPGTSGSLVWTIPTADGGSDKVFTLANFMVFEKAYSFKQGAPAEFSLGGKAKSSNGTTSPLSIA